MGVEKWNEVVLYCLHQFSLVVGTHLPNNNKQGLHNYVGVDLF